MKNICVKIPDKCYISPNPKKTAYCPFSFDVTYGSITNSKVSFLNSKIKYPQITISGFNKLISDSVKMEDFVNNLKKTGDDDWIILKDKSTDNIIIRYTGDELSPDFFFRASTERFTADTKENELVVLNVKIEGFDDVSDNAYAISIKVDYMPWAKSISGNTPVDLNSYTYISYEYMGDNVDIRLCQNGETVETARSPYNALINKPSLFTLDVFNNIGVMDRTQKNIDVNPPYIEYFKADKYFFSKGDAINLSWNILSSSGFKLEGINKDTDTIKDNSAIVYPSFVYPTVSYTLRANGYVNGDPESISEPLTLQRTFWTKEKPQKGYFEGEVYDNIKCNNRIFNIGGNIYCYAHPNLYKCSDGVNWESFSENKSAPSNVVYIASDCHNNTVYVMGKYKNDDSDALYICTYDFSAGTWKGNSAGQVCISDMGCFGFSSDIDAYAQIVENGMMIVRRRDDEWNIGSSVIMAPLDRTIVGGDYCFFKDSFYTAFLCDNSCIYIYKNNSSIEEALWRIDTNADDKFVSLIATVNNLYAVTSSSIIDAVTGQPADMFSPAAGIYDKRMWLGRNSNGKLLGIFPDKNLWTFNY